MTMLATFLLAVSEFLAAAVIGAISVLVVLLAVKIYGLFPRKG